MARQRILLVDVPPGYTRISSSLGEAPPSSILVLPVVFEGQVKAVIELATFGEFNETQQQFIDQLMESIGIVLNTIAANMREPDDIAGPIMRPSTEQGSGTQAGLQVVVADPSASALRGAQDPIGELGLTFGGHGKENTFWEQTLRALADSLGAPGAQVLTTVVCVDRKRQWSRATNVRNSVAIRSTLHMLRPSRSR